MEERKESFMLIPGAILASGLIIAGAIVYVSGARPSARENAGSIGAAAQAPARQGLLEDGNDPVRGDPQAPVTIVEFSDFQCPYCGKFWRDSLPEVLERYVKTGKARFVYRDFPLMQAHREAEKAAEASACAFEQQKFWEYHDTIFINQSALSMSNLKQWARQIGLDGNRFDECLDSGKNRDEVLKDYSDGLALGVSGTPSFFINGELLVGAVSAEEMASVIDAALARKK